MSKLSGLAVVLAAALVLIAAVDSASYTTALVRADSVVKVTSSPDALFGVPTFDDVPYALSVPRGETRSLTFDVTPRISGPAVISFAPYSVPGGLGCLCSADTDRLACNMSVSPDRNLEPGIYLVQTAVSVQGEGVRGRVNVAIPVSVTFRAPDAIDDQATTLPNTSVTIPIAMNDDGDGDPATTVVSVTAPDHGSVQVLPGGLSVVYIPSADWTGDDVFFYVLQNSVGSDSAMVTIAVGP